VRNNAIISVYDKSNIVPFASELVDMDWKIFSSGGTAKVLREAGLDVTDVAELSGLPPILDHRVVTLVPQVHAGLLAEDKHEHWDQLRDRGFHWFDLLCVDFYPLKEETRHPGATRQSVIDKTDIGGPAMVRSAAKGRRIVVVEPSDRWDVLAWLRTGRQNEKEYRNALAAKAEGLVADYCLESAKFHSGGVIWGEVVVPSLALARTSMSK
jgi:phosphoribosylaminoimidazolecarboxamide formyltransferase / IMP cyclohydrolase